MSGRHVFRFDAATCSGCKACEIACRDRNALPEGVAWRRVYEVSAGDWQQQEGAWYQDVFAYNVSLACNHCERPICTEVCPTGAMQQRADGIVLVDANRCVGCGYCAWACPYAAPQLDPRTGAMSKCTACFEDVDAGVAPACVAACPLRSLEHELQPQPVPQAAAALPPMPDPRLTLPQLQLGEPACAKRVRSGRRLEVRRDGAGADARGAETSLVAFTLLVQAGAGLMVAALIAGMVSGSVLALSTPVSVAALLAAAALPVSLLHLGRARNAWRTLHNVRRSWLSREILATGAFALLTGAAALACVTGAAGAPALLSLSALTGVLAVGCMAGVYRLRTIAAWNRPRTSLSFFGAALLLGSTLFAVTMLRQGLPATLAWLALAGAVTVSVLDRLSFYRARPIRMA